MREIDRVTGIIVHCALQVHQETGPGLLESVYEAVLYRKLVRSGLHVERQKKIQLVLNGEEYEEKFRVDLLVEGIVIVEIKSVERMAAVCWKQLLTYLKLTNLEVGLLINFGCPTLREGLFRVVNNYQGGRLTPALPRSTQ